MPLFGSTHACSIKICPKKFLKNWEPYRSGLNCILGMLKIMAFLVLRAKVQILWSGFELYSMVPSYSQNHTVDSL